MMRPSIPGQRLAQKRKCSTRLQEALSLLPYMTLGRLWMFLEPEFHCLETKMMTPAHMGLYHQLSRLLSRIGHLAKGTQAQLTLLSSTFGAFD